MQQYKMAEVAIVEKAKSERNFQLIALLLSTILILGGFGLLVLGVGDHLDIVVKAQGIFETRIINSTPGFGALFLGILLFLFSKPRRLKANATHQDEPAANEEFIALVEGRIQKVIQASLESRKLLSVYQLEEIIRTLNERLDLIEGRDISSPNKHRPIQAEPSISKEKGDKVKSRLEEGNSSKSGAVQKSVGSVNVLYQSGGRKAKE